MSRFLLVLPDDTAQPILDAIGQAQASLRIKMFVLSDPSLLRAIAAAHRRGVKVQVMLNPERRDGKKENADSRKYLSDAGVEVKDSNPAFEVTHEKRMHLIVVRRDGRGFQHLHPTLGADGTWSAPITLSDAGAYRVFADFQRGGEARTLAADLTVDGPAAYAPLPAANTVTQTDGYTVKLNPRGSELAFDMPKISRDMIVVIQALVILFTGALENLVRIPVERAFLWRRRPG